MAEREAQGETSSPSPARGGDNEAVSPEERAAVLATPPVAAEEKPRSTRLRTVLLAVLMMLVPAGLLAASLAFREMAALPGGLPVIIVVALLALVIEFLAARGLQTPWAFVVSLMVAVLGATNFLFAAETLAAFDPYARYAEIPVLVVLFLGVVGLLAGFQRHQRESNPVVRLGAKLGLLTLLVAFALAGGHLLSRHYTDLEALWLGPWAAGVAVALVAAGLGFVRPVLLPGEKASPEGAAAKPKPRVALTAFAIVILSLAAAAALAGLVLADYDSRAMLTCLAIVFVTAALVGTHLNGHGAKVFRAIAAMTMALWAGCWLATVGRIVSGQPLGAVLLGNVTAATGFTIAATVVYLFGLFTIPKEGRWNQSVALVAGMGLGLVGYFWLATLGGQATFTWPPFSHRTFSISATDIMYFQALVLLATAWRVRWEPAVYLGALGLLATVGVQSVRLYGSHSYIALQHLTSSVAVVGAGLALSGGLVAIWRKRFSLARFYCEGLLVTGLFGAALMAFLSIIGVLEVGLSLEGVVLLASLTLSLLLAALVFRQEDLFGFFGLSLLLLTLAAFGVRVGSEPGSYLYRYATVCLVCGLALALAAAGLAGFLRNHKGFQNFGAALYVSAFTAATVVLVIVSLSKNHAYGALDLLGVAVILAFMYPHIRYTTVSYAVMAAIVAAVYSFVAAFWGHNHVEFVEAAILATALLAVMLILISIVVRRLLPAQGAAPEKGGGRHDRPFTVVAFAFITVLACYLTLLTVLKYEVGLGDGGLWANLFLVEQIDPLVIVLGWIGVLLTFLFSIWVFRHSARTVGFYLVGSLATLSVGLLPNYSPNQLRNYLICAIAGYGAVHLAVYLWERPYMAMLARFSSLYRDERKASTAIFTASCISCFIGAIIAAFFLHTAAALVTLWILTAVFFVWSFGHRRAELLYPAVLMSVGALLSIWHYAEGPGNWDTWTATRVNINAMVFACGGLLWLTVGTVLDRLRGPMSILNAPARQMSVILGLTGLGFFIALALSPLRLDEAWRDVSTQRFVLGVTCGLALVGLFGWAAASFRRTLWVYFAELSLAVLLLFLGLRLPSVYENPQFQEFWPVLPALLALVMLAVAKLLEGQRIVLFGHPLFFTAVFFLPLAPLVETVRRLMRGEYLAAIITLVLLAAVAFFGSSYRLVARWRSGGRAK